MYYFNEAVWKIIGDNAYKNGEAQNTVVILEVNIYWVATLGWNSP